AAGIDQQADRDAAPPRSARLVQPVAQEAARAQVGATLYAGVDVDVLAVGLPTQAHALGPQCLELAADAVQVRAVAGEGGVDPGCVAGQRRHHAHRGAVFDVGPIRMVPLGIAVARVALAVALELEYCAA